MTFQAEAEVEAFRAALAENDVATLLEALELVDFVAPAELIEVYLSPNNLKNLAQQAAAYGCDELADVVARLSVGGEEWYQCMQCARYGDKWYNIAFSGSAGSAGGQRLRLRDDAPMPHEQGARALRFGSGEAGEGVDGDKPTRRGLPPAGRQCRRPAPSAPYTRAHAPRAGGNGAAFRFW